MKNLLFILSLLACTQLFALSTCKSDTIKISIIGNEISIEADDIQELEELLKHDLNSLLKNLNLNLSKHDEDSNTELNLELIVQNDSIIEHIQIVNSSSNSFNSSVNGKKTKKIISISDAGIFIETEIEKKNTDVLLEKLEEYAEESMNYETEEIDSTKGTFMISEVHIGFNNYLNDKQKIVSGEDYSLKSSLGSFAYVSYAKTRIFSKVPLFLKYGLGLRSNNYKYANNYVLSESNYETILLENPNEIVKSKLSTLFIEAPLLLQLDFSSNIREENGFNIAVGPFVGYMLKAKTKLIYLDENDNSNKEKQKGEFHLNKVRYGLQAQFGVMGFNFYAKYHLSTLFENNKGPQELNVIDFGIVFDI